MDWTEWAQSIETKIMWKDNKIFLYDSLIYRPHLDFMLIKSGRENVLKVFFSEIERSYSFVTTIWDKPRPNLKMQN